ncbi:MAG: HAMP domain-containing histidine kinase [Clostridia bacterium]|nr:HAMP domain-containing histidine kinase [Clostridia bacterium]
MRRRLFTKYFLATGIVIVVSLTIMMMIMTLVYSKYLSDSKYDTLKTSCDSVTSFYDREPKGMDDFESQKRFYFVLNNLSNVSGNDIFVTDNDGRVVICNCDEWFKNEGHCEHTGTVIDSKILENASEKNKGEITTLGIYTDQHYVATKNIKNQSGHIIGVVVATSPISDMTALFESIGKIYIFSAIIPLVIIFVALYVITNRLTKPLKLMSIAAKSMANGDFSRRIPVTTDDEIGELAMSFNEMTNSLSRLESMRKTFIADVSHELKTPMTTIGGFIDGIIDGTIEQEKEKHYLNLVSEEIKRLSRMVEAMLNLARLESDEFSLKPEKFDFGKTVINIVLSQEKRIEEGNINIEGLDTFEDVSVFADRDLIFRVIYNLVDNAIKFTDKSGTISFKLTTDKEKLMFAVSNTGKGIKKEDLPYVFERFYKSDKSRSANKNSTGLGLNMAKTIIKKHGGQISVKSKENELTTFSIVLPL